MKKRFLIIISIMSLVPCIVMSMEHENLSPNSQLWFDINFTAVSDEYDLLDPFYFQVGLSDGLKDKRFGCHLTNELSVDVDDFYKLQSNFEGDFGQDCFDDMNNAVSVENKKRAFSYVAKNKSAKRRKIDSYECPVSIVTPFVKTQK